MDQGAEEEAEDVSVDAETAEQVVDAIMKQYPGAVITISVQLPEETPFDTDLVAAAQEVVGGGAEGGEEVGAEVAPEADPSLDGAAPDAAAGSPEDLMEKRKVIISKTRKQIKEMFARMSEEGEDEVPAVDPAADPAAEVAPEADPSLDGAAPAEDVLEPETEVGDTKIALSPEQWGQVLATSDLLNGGAEGEEGDVGSEEVPGAELAPEAGAEDGAAPAEEPIDELRTEVDLDGPGAKMQILKKIEKGDFKKGNDKKQDVAIKPAGMNESFNAELAGYADSLSKLLIKE
jgi:hypothetical protein